MLELGGPKDKKQSGLTLIEMVVTVVILAIALTGIAITVAQGLSQSAKTLLEVKRVALEQAYLDEILAKRFDENSHVGGIPPCFGLKGDPGPLPIRCTGPCTDVGVLFRFCPDSGESSRNRYDDVDDYHGLDEGDGRPNPLQDAEGEDRDGYENFRVQVNVRYAGADAVLGLTEGLTDTHAKLITVTISNRGQSVGADFSVYKANF